MKIQIRTDNNLHVHEDRAVELEDVIKNALRHCSNHITRVEVHLSGVSGGKPGQKDKTCVMEARLEHRQPMAVTELAETVSASVAGAGDKLARLVKSTLGRAAANRPAQPDAEPGIAPPESDIEE